MEKWTAMDLKEFSKRELISILEIIDECRNCDSREHIKMLLMRSKDLLEADYAICGMVSLKGSEPRDPVTIVNGNYPEDWLKRYTSEKMYHTDPVVSRHARYSSTYLWEDISNFDSKIPETVGHALDHGIRFGLSGSIYIPRYEDISIFAFAGDKNRYIEHHRKIIDILSLHLNRALINITYELPALEMNDFTGHVVEVAKQA